MANDIHVWLSDEEAEQVRSAAKQEDRSLTKMARALIREALVARQPHPMVSSARKAMEAVYGPQGQTIADIRPLVEDCVTTDPPKHDLAAQVRTLGADSLLPDPRMTVTPSREPEVTPRFKAAKGKP